MRAASACDGMLMMHNEPIHVLAMTVDVPIGRGVEGGMSVSWRHRER